jgi:hypothetical protein
MCFAKDGDTVLRRDQISAAKFMGIIASVAVLTFVSCCGDYSCECQLHRTRELSRGKSALEIARKIRFRERFQADLGCPVAREKIFRFSLSPNQWLCVPCPAFTRGALRDRHERWKRDAMDASVRKTNAPSSVRPSRVVLMPRRRHQVPDRLTLLGNDGGKKARSPGRTRNKPLRPSRRECRNALAYL